MPHGGFDKPSRAVADKSRTIRVPVHITPRITQIRQVYAELIQQLSREPSLDEIAAAADTSREEVSTVMRVIRNPTSLHGPVGKSEEGELGDLLPNENQRQPDEAVLRSTLQQRLNHLLDANLSCART